MPLVIYVMGLAIFAIGTSELMVAGMMNSLSVAFDITIGEVGHLISYFAFGVMVGGPVLTYIFLKLRVPYRATLLALLGMYVVVQGFSAFINDHSTLVAIRIITGVLCAGCLSLSLTTSMALVEREKRPQASAVVIGGFMISNVFGVPLATIINEQWGWRISFGLVAILVFLCFVALVRMLPSTENEGRGVSVSEEMNAFKNAAYWKACLTSCLILGASFAAFSYFVPILSNVSGFSIQAITVILVLYGSANIVGTFFTSQFAHRNSLGIMVAGLSVLSMALIGMALLADIKWLAVLFVVLIGLAGLPMNPAMMARIVSVAHPGPLVNAVHTSVINVGLGGGSYLGGVAISAGYGYNSALWIGAALAVMGLLSILPYVLRRQYGWS